MNNGADVDIDSLLDCGIKNLDKIKGKLDIESRELLSIYRQLSEIVDNTNDQRYGNSPEVNMITEDIRAVHGRLKAFLNVP